MLAETEATLPHGILGLRGLRFFFNNEGFRD